MSKKMNSEQTEVLKKVLRYMRRYWSYLAISILLAAITVASTLYIPLLTGDAAEQAQGGQTYRLRQKGSGSDKGSKKGIATGRNRSRGPAPHYRQTIHKPVI